MIIFWILFVWLPAILYVAQFWKYSVSWPNVSFNIKEECGMVLFLMTPTSGVIAFCVMLDIIIEYYIWGKND